MLAQPSPKNHSPPSHPEEGSELASEHDAYGVRRKRRPSEAFAPKRKLP